MKKSKESYRHELKYLISTWEKEFIEKKIAAILKQDIHSVDGGYMIRSLYFDDLWENAYNEKLAGTSSRKKYRIRCYNGQKDVIKLEKKKKEGQYIYKEAANLTEKEFLDILSGEVDFLKKSDHFLKQEFYYEIKTNQMRPKVIVDYEREPYVLAYGDVRITFDSHIRAAISGYDIFDLNIPTIEVLPKDQLIMEVKFTEYLPEMVRDILPHQDVALMAASKYVMCLEKQKEFCRR